ncbi:MAG: glycosyl transferase family 1, partial [Vicinamibacterales bacterium]
MRIVFLSPSGELGGAETALLDILAAIREARPDWPLAMIAASGGPLLAKAAVYADATAMPFPKALARLGEWGTRGSLASHLRLAARLLAASAPVAMYARRLEKRLRDFNPDIIHSNGLKMHLLGARARTLPAKLVWHLHD